MRVRDTLVFVHRVVSYSDVHAETEHRWIAELSWIMGWAVPKMALRHLVHDQHFYSCTWIQD